MWTRDGKEILFLGSDTIFAVEVEKKGTTLHASLPQPLFRIRRPGGMVNSSHPLAVSGDSQRILFAQGVEQPDPQLNYAMTAWERKLR